jgi:Annexin
MDTRAAHAAGRPAPAAPRSGAEQARPATPTLDLASPSSPAPPASVSPAALAALQGTAGNRATVQALRASGTVHVQRAIGWDQAQETARQLHRAMAGWGTDEEAIYGALAGRTGDDMRDIRDVHRQMYSQSLDAELRDELTDSEFARVKPVLDAPADTTMTPLDREIGAMDRSYAVAGELRAAMQGWGTDETQIFNALTGRTPSEIEAITSQYLMRYNRTLEEDLRDELSGGDLARALQLIGRVDQGTFENRVREDLVEGIHAVVQGRFNYTLTPTRLDVDVPVHFLPAAGITVPLARWNTQIDGVWNQFKITEPGGRQVAVKMALRDDTSASRQIRVIKNANPGVYANPDRADAGKFYEVMPPDTAPHEFGHLIGLPDEYQRTANDFEAVTGETRSGPPNRSGKTEQQIATELNTALTDPNVNARAGRATAVCTSVGLISGGLYQQGDFAQAVMAAYDAAYGGGGGKTLTAELQSLPAGSNWSLTMVFSFASTTVMGASGQVTALSHEHPVMPRHLREFRAIVANRWPEATWEIT